jgi:hypothetical protein
MNCPRLRLAPALLLALAAGLAPAPRAEEPGRTLASWTFDRDLDGWAPNDQVQEARIEGGMLRARTVGSDPILELRPRVAIPATARQFVEVRLRADRDGEAELFWSGTDRGRFGGFDQEKTKRFAVVGDGQWRTYTLFPGWQAERTVVRLRLDLYDGAGFALDSIRLAELPTPPAVDRPAFDFASGAAGWQGVAGATLAAEAGGVAIATPSEAGFALAPPVRIEADAAAMLAVRMAVDRGRRATLLFATDGAPGLRSLGFPIVADGRERTYNVDLLAARDWRGRVVALGLRPSDDPAARAVVRRLAVGAEPEGPAQVEVVALAAEAALPRVGVPFGLAATIGNTGGEPAAGLRAALTLPPGLRLVDGAAEVAVPGAPGFGEEATLRWTVQADAPLAGDAQLVVRSAAPGVEAATARTSLRVTPRLAVDRAPYVPEPRPVRGPYEVGAYYFPGWPEASRWAPITRFPERRPVLGWYREGDPEVADWHIKWAVEHGITFFAYDWYWDRGNRQLEHGLHDGYFKAKYRHLLKFCLLWANHNPPGSSSREDCVAVARHWVENYFRRPEHLTVDGKPVVILFAPGRLREDLGAAGAREAIAAMRAERRAAGLPGLHLVACVGDAGGARQAAAEGYDAVTCYNWAGLGMTGRDLHGPFETLIDGYRRQWDHLLAEAPIPLAPLPLSGGWDSRPWHGENHLVRYGRTPELFGRHLRDARARLDAGRGGGMALVEAWNEWGEGSYIEPHREFGFGYLDAIREIFTDAPEAHEDLTPADVGRGPYDVPPGEPARTAWDFGAGGLAGWSAMMDLAPAKAEGGALRTRTTGPDPALVGPPLKAPAAGFAHVVVRMALRPGDGRPSRDLAQLFWATSRLPEGEASSRRFEAVGDGQMREYRVPVGTSPRWRGTITRLRLDPGTRAGVEVAIEAIRLEP